MAKNCKLCFHAKTNGKKARCECRIWDKSYSLDSVVDNRIPILLKLPRKCEFYSPPEVELRDSYIKDDNNKQCISRLINAVRDNKRYFDFEEPMAITKYSYWEKWE